MLLTPVRLFFVILDLAWKTKRKKTKTHSNTMFLPIFNDRNNNYVVIETITSQITKNFIVPTIEACRIFVLGVVFYSPIEIKIFIKNTPNEDIGSLIFCLRSCRYFCKAMRSENGKFGSSLFSNFYLFHSFGSVLTEFEIKCFNKNLNKCRSWQGLKQ